MKYVFIINPAAGQGEGIDSLVDHIIHVSKKCNKESEIYLTAGVGDAEVIANQLAVENNEDLRIIVCGGDGTLNEVVNGVYGFDVPVGIVPIGTGNDFVRNFGDAEDYMDIEAQFDFEPVEVNLLKFKYKEYGKNIEKYCVNVFNIGFDGNVAILAGKLKELPLIAGSFAYLSSILFNLLTKKGQDLMIIADGKKFYRGPLLLCSVANGKYCGGGICSNPKADMNDGLMDLQIVKNVSRRLFVKLLPSYIKGEILDKPELSKTILFDQVKKVEITPKYGNMTYCVDGEPITTGAVKIEMRKKGFKFLKKVVDINK